jgi:tetratricopeptide (TPR) repeat protein
MNPKGGLNVSDEQLASVAAYVWSLSQPEPHGFITAQWRFLELTRAGQFAEARAVFQATREKYPDNLLVPENGMNAFGYEFLGRGDIDGAIEVFQFNVDLHPESFNPWDSLAEAYMAKGDNEHAIEYYEKSLELNPENTNAVDKLKELGAR